MTLKTVEPMNRQSWKRKVILTCAAIFAVLFWFCLPEPLFVKPTSFVVESRDGALLGAAIASDGQWRFPGTDSLPEKFRKCIVSFEDKRFFRHPGIDILAIGRAIAQNLKKRPKRERRTNS